MLHRTADTRGRRWSAGSPGFLFYFFNARNVRTLTRFGGTNLHGVETLKTVIHKTHT